jgi:hypothetical protein
VNFDLPPERRRDFSGSLCQLLRYETGCPHARSLADVCRSLPHNSPPEPNCPPPVNEKSIWELLVNNYRFEVARRYVPGPGATATSEWWVRCFHRRCDPCLKAAGLPPPPSGVAWQSRGRHAGRSRSMESEEPPAQNLGRG